MHMPWLWGSGPKNASPLLQLLMLPASMERAISAAFLAAMADLDSHKATNDCWLRGASCRAEKAALVTSLLANVGVSTKPLETCMS